MSLILKIIGIILSILSGILYRMGGSKNYNTKFRDFGVPLCGIITLFLLGVRVSLLSYFLTFGLMFASMLSYYKKKETDAKWWNWALVGFFFGLSTILITLGNGNWLGFGIRTILLTIGVCLWSIKIDNVVWEEMGRGIIFTASLPLLI